MGTIESAFQNETAALKQIRKHSISSALVARIITKKGRKMNPISKLKTKLKKKYWHWFVEGSECSRVSGTYCTAPEPPHLTVVMSCRKLLHGDNVHDRILLTKTSRPQTPQSEHQQRHPPKALHLSKPSKPQTHSSKNRTGIPNQNSTLISLIHFLHDKPLQATTLPQLEKTEEWSVESAGSESLTEHLKRGEREAERKTSIQFQRKPFLLWLVYFRKSVNLFLYLLLSSAATTTKGKKKQKSQQQSEPQVTISVKAEQGERGGVKKRGTGSFPTFFLSQQRGSSCWLMLACVTFRYPCKILSPTF